MRTSKYPYNKKIGLNIANQFFKFVDNKTIGYLDLFFRDNEREAIGRRILISIYILEEYDYLSIISKTGCGRQTYSTIKKQLSYYKGNSKKLLKDLREIYFSQFPKKTRASMYSRNASGINNFFNLSNSLDQDNKKVNL
ncbi:hypothetical protein KA001_01090 [Patescibacteria group bacterium]|nr:hypothetical protein [Patescibacteria group bacterium]